MTCVSEFFFFSYDVQWQCTRTKNNHPDDVQAIMCPSGLVWQLFQTNGQKPPTEQNKGPQDFPYKCAVERTLKPM